MLPSPHFSFFWYDHSLLIFLYYLRDSSFDPLMFVVFPGWCFQAFCNVKPLLLWHTIQYIYNKNHFLFHIQILIKTFMFELFTSIDNSFSLSFEKFDKKKIYGKKKSLHLPSLDLVVVGALCAGCPLNSFSLSFFRSWQSLSFSLLNVWKLCCRCTVGATKTI